MEAGCIAETVLAGLTSEGEGWSRDPVRTRGGQQRVLRVDRQQVVRFVTCEYDGGIVEASDEG